MRIVADKLSKRFNREWIFKDLDYQFVPSHVYAITGPNGSGKSTLLQALWGQVPVSRGNVRYYEEEKEIAVEDVFNYISIATPYMDLIEEFTLEEMVRFHFKFKKPYGNYSTEQICDLLELPKAKTKLLSDFSSGMRQRVKLGLAFFSHSKALFLDEPTTNLDKKSTAWYLQRLEETPKSTLIFIASNQEHEYPASSVKIDIVAYK